MFEKNKERNPKFFESIALEQNQPGLSTHERTVQAVEEYGRLSLRERADYSTIPSEIFKNLPYFLQFALLDEYVRFAQSLEAFGSGKRNDYHFERHDFIVPFPLIEEQDTDGEHLDSYEIPSSPSKAKLSLRYRLDEMNRCIVDAIWIESTVEGKLEKIYLLNGDSSLIIDRFLDEEGYDSQTNAVLMRTAPDSWFRLATLLHEIGHSKTTTEWSDHDISYKKLHVHIQMEANRNTLSEFALLKELRKRYPISLVDITQPISIGNVAEVYNAEVQASLYGRTVYQTLLTITGLPEDELTVALDLFYASALTSYLNGLVEMVGKSAFPLVERLRRQRLSHT